MQKSQFREMVERILQENGLYEMAYPSNFSLDEFSQLKTFKERENYCRNRLKLCGNGSARLAFEIDNEKVLKIAKSRAGIAQNKLEIKKSDPKYSCLAQVFEYDKVSFNWLEMEKAERAFAKDFMIYFGFEYSWLNDMLIYIYGQYSNLDDNDRFSKEELADFDAFFKKYVNTNKYPDFSAVYQYLLEVKPDRTTIADFAGKSNWGIVNRNGQKHLVIIDNGYNREIYDQFYNRHPSA